MPDFLVGYFTGALVAFVAMVIYFEAGYMSETALLRFIERSRWRKQKP